MAQVSVLNTTAVPIKTFAESDVSAHKIVSFVFFVSLMADYLLLSVS